MSSDQTIHTLCHLEIQTTDMEVSKRFYIGVFGWEFRAYYEGMEVFGKGEQHIGGLMLVSKVEPGLSPSLWFKVQNIEDSINHGVTHGGSLKEAKSEVPHVGWSAVMNDPFGTPIGIVQYI